MGSHTSAHVLDAIRRIVQALRESSRDAEQQVGLSGAQLFVLHALAESPGLSMNELAERTRTHQSSVSVVVSHLSRAGLVERRTSRSDARRAEVRLSPSGRVRLHRSPRTAQERLIATVNAMPASDRARLASMLDRLVRGMSLPRRRPAMFFEDHHARKTTRRRHA